MIMKTLRYFYRPDHLGSTLWVTDSAKNGVQYCEYLPYGEPFIDQRSTTWSSRYTFSGKERDSETGYSYFGARYYHSDLSIWLSVDPLSDKYPNLTPYAYCANNPVQYVDPDGKEKIIALNKENKKEQTIIAGAEKYTDDGAIHIFGHGNSTGMFLNINGTDINVTDANQLETFLSEYSTTWQNKNDGDKIVIVLHSCNTGRDNKDGTASFAEEISKSDIFNDATIIAPNERVYFSENGEVGAYKAKYANKYGEYKRNEKGDIKSKERSNIPGSWRVFEKGKQTGQYRGDWKPKVQPTFWDKLTKKEEVK